jgi:hypothetical protein
VDAVGVLLESGSDVQPVLAVHVRSGPEFLATLTTGNAPTHRAASGPQGLTLLSPIADSAARPALAVADNYLIVARTAELITRAGPYLVRTLSARARSAAADLRVEVGKPALSGVLAAIVESRWRALRSRLEAADEAARRERGRAPDFADPKALLAALDRLVGGAITAIRAGDRLDVSVSATAERLEGTVELALDPKLPPPPVFADMKSGDPQPLLGLPNDTRAALLSWSSEPERRETAARIAATLQQILGKRLDDATSKQLSESLDALAAARSDALVLGVIGSSTPALCATQHVGNGPAFDAALQRLLRSLEQPAFAEPLAQFVGKPVVRFANTQDAARVEIAFRPGNQRLNLVWNSALEPRRLCLGSELADTLKNLTTWSAAEPTLAAASDVASAVQRVARAAWLTLLIRPDRVGLSASPSAPGVAAIGYAARTATLRVELPGSLVEALIMQASL